MRIGLLGGSFDPIHYGHVHIALQAQKRLHLDEVWFLPTLSTPLKDKQLTDFRIRCEMVRMMLKPYRRFHLSLIETKNTLPSYTINTARRLRRMYPDDQFYFIIGTDQLAQLDRWKDIDELTGLLQFVCMKRSEEQIHNDRVIMIDCPVHPASSTAVRNGDFRYIPVFLRRYIMKNALYDRTIAESMYTDPDRWTHALSVAELSARIAAANNMDAKAAYRAGLFHDCTKRFDFTDMQDYYLSFDATQQEKKLPAKVVHQITAYSYLKREMKLEDKAILNAIRHHTTGDLNQPLVKLLFAADKLDPSREYDSSKTIELCLQSLEKGFQEVRKQQREYLLKQGITPLEVE